MIHDEADNLIFQAMAHHTRRSLLDALRDGPRTTGDLCALLPQIDRCTVMQHLTVLVAAGLVVPERRGRERWNHLNVIPIQRLHDRWIGPLAAPTARKLRALEDSLTTESQR